MKTSTKRRRQPIDWNEVAAITIVLALVLVAFSIIWNFSLTGVDHQVCSSAANRANASLNCQEVK